jgi:hypothetical protein
MSDPLRISNNQQLLNKKGDKKLLGTCIVLLD